VKNSYSPCVDNSSGYLLVNKPKGRTAFNLVAAIRRKLSIRTVGHAGTLDPMATGVMVLLIGREYTRLSDTFMAQEKEYVARIHLGIVTDSYDAEGAVIAQSEVIPTAEALNVALQAFQGQIMQVPPMFSAKKIDGQKLYHLARQGKTVERPAVPLTVHIEMLEYAYPHIDLSITCSKGTYIRSIAHDLGQALGCGGHLTALVRTRSGSFALSDCIDGELLYAADSDLRPFIRRKATAHET
jgi:tRNA pseudouridine55 synthase